MNWQIKPLLDRKDFEKNHDKEQHTIPRYKKIRVQTDEKVF